MYLRLRCTSKCVEFAGCEQQDVWTILFEWHSQMLQMYVVNLYMLNWTTEEVSTMMCKTKVFLENWSQSRTDVNQPDPIRPSPLIQIFSIKKNENQLFNLKSNFEALKNIPWKQLIVFLKACMLFFHVKKLNFEIHFHQEVYFFSTIKSIRMSSFELCEKWVTK